MTSYTCFIQTLVITCTVSEILAQIDDKGLVFKGHLYWFHSLHISSQYWHHPNEVAWCKINGQHFSTAERFLIIWLKLRKNAQSDLSGLKKDIQSDSIISIFWPFINTILGKVYAYIEKKLLNSVLINGHYVLKWVKNS